MPKIMRIVLIRSTSNQKQIINFRERRTRNSLRDAFARENRRIRHESGRKSKSLESPRQSFFEIALDLRADSAMVHRIRTASKLCGNSQLHPFSAKPAKQSTLNPPEPSTPSGGFSVFTRCAHCANQIPLPWLSTHAREQRITHQLSAGTEQDPSRGAAMLTLQPKNSPHCPTLNSWVILETGGR
jgi:hypothetical protein